MAGRTSDEQIMKLAYVTTYDSSDIHAWSGLGAYILAALQNSGFQTEALGGLKNNHDLVLKIKEVFYPRILSKSYLRSREPSLLQNYAVQLERFLASIRCDVIFSPGTLPISYLQTEKPIVFWTDATFAGMIDYYPGFSNLCAETNKNGNQVEQQALTKCRLAIYSSTWAANTAIQYYDVDPVKVKVVPFGANIRCSRDLRDIHSMLKTKNYDVCKLLFVGKEWFRKGGDIAVQVAGRLNQRGIPAELHVLGCNPPGDLPDYVKVHGFVSKASEAGTLLLDQLFSQSHFFILPSRADCSPVVFPEACSFGLPSLTTNIGGIPTAIQDGKNGYTFPLDEGLETYCDTIERLWHSKQEYELLALSSFREYNERLNWASSGRKVYELIQEYCG